MTSTDLEELAVRLRALVRRSKGETAPVLQIGSLVLGPAAHTVTREGQEVELQTREFALLQELMLNAGRTIGHMKGFASSTEGSLRALGRCQHPRCQMLRGPSAPEWAVPSKRSHWSPSRGRSGSLAEVE